jgi:hypothetical protein
MKWRRLPIAGMLLGLAPAQDVLWQIPTPPGPNTRFGFIEPFVDYNGDGYRDLLLTCLLNYQQLGQQSAGIQILSGLDGSVLQTVALPVLFRAVHAGDVNGDQLPDLLLRISGTGTAGQNGVQAYSLATQTVLWQNVGPSNHSYAWTMLGNIDVDGDARADAVTMTSHTSDSRVFVYNSDGSTRYTLQVSGVYGVAISLAQLGDRDGDGGDDFLVGINDYSTRGTILLISGRTGAVLRTTQGLQPGDKTCDFVSNLGDIDGDGVPDYAGFPWITASNAVVVCYSGQTGQVIRTLPEFGNSVIVGEDFDLDGVPDLAIGADWQVTTAPPHCYGQTRAYSGRDGTELWRVNNLPYFNDPTGSNGGNGWMEYSAALGPQPGNPYAAIAWMDLNWFLTGTVSNRIRAWRTNFAAQGPVTGAACSTTAQTPIIGVRQTQPTVSSSYTHHTRITVARGLPGSLGLLCLDYATATSFAGLTLPIALDPIGLPGCQLYVGPTATALCVLGTQGIDRGYAVVELGRPMSATTTGTAIVAQWVLLDFGNLDHAVTQKHQLRFQ